MSEEQIPGGEPDITAVAVNLTDLIDDEIEEEEDLALEDEAQPEEPELAEDDDSGGGDLDDIMDDIFADEHEEDDRLKAFGDLEHLTMTEVESEVEAVLEQLRTRQGGYE